MEGVVGKSGGVGRSYNGAVVTDLCALKEAEESEELGSAEKG